ncbi:tetratricopeptide repeat protein [Streptomyces sp. NPDC005531]|uniref:tetratricopeptide repeat protein n=1 Tax=Streptomyces sp. NPDC005531 TaxID=3364722 RepID=UPI0036BA0606
MLRPEYGVADFIGRDREMAELSSWRDSRLQFSVMLVHGAGGQGKTRLAMHFAEDSTARDWQALEASHDTSPTTSSRPGTAEREIDGRLLIIVDYAETWPIDDLLHLFNGVMHRKAVSRVLLLARSTGNWWRKLHERLKSLDAAPHQISLSPLAETKRDGASVFRRAVTRFADLLDVDEDSAKSVSPPVMTGDGWRSVLSIHAEALLATEAAGRSDISAPNKHAGPSEARTQSAHLLKREFRHWHALHSAGKLSTRPEIMGRMVFIATLTRALPYPHALAALRQADLVETRMEAYSLLKDHAYCYPPDEPNTALEPISPERLGEDFLALTVPGHNVEGFVGDPWAASAIYRILVPDEASDGLPDYAAAAINVLIETAHRWPHVAREYLSPLLIQHPELATTVGGAAMVRLAEVPHMDLDALEAVEPLLPIERGGELDEANAAIASRLIPRRLQKASTESDLAVLLANWGYRLSQGGRRNEAVEPVDRAIEIYRRLATVDPATFKPRLAAALNNLGGDLSHLERFEAALQAYEEAIDVYRNLARSAPGTYLPDLATALGNIAGMLSRLGRRSDALAAATEAVAVRRQLVESEPLTYEPDLANSLNILGIHLSAVGHWDEAVAAASEAVEIRRRLMESAPDAHTPGLATALNNLGGMLSSVGRREDALQAAVEATAVYRRLVQAGFFEFQQDLAVVLSNFGSRLAAVGRWDEAVAAASEAVEIRRRLMDANPDAHTPGLSAALNNLGGMLSSVGRREDALGAGGEAVSLYRRLTEANPAAFQPELAGALTNLGTRLAELGRHEDALAASGEAVSLYRRLTEANPAAFQPQLAGALTNLGTRLAELGRHEDALAASGEAVSLYRRLTETHPAAFQPQLAGALTNLGTRQVELGRPEDALGASGEAVSLYRRLAEANPAAFQLGLARGLQVYAWIRAAVQHELSDALIASGEAIRIYEHCASWRDPESSGLLRDALSTHAVVLDRLGRNEEAAGVRHRIVEVI